MTAAPILDYAPTRTVFSRPAHDKVLGALTYLIAGPFLSAILGLFVAAIAFGSLSEWLHVGETFADYAAIGSGGIACLGGLWWAFRDYRRRALAELIVDHSGIELRSAGHRRYCPLDDLDGVRLCQQGTQLLFDLRDGSRLYVPTDLVTADDALAALGPVILEPLARRHEREIAAGATIQIRDLGSRAVGQAVSDIGLFCLGILAVATIRFCFVGARMISLAIVGLRQCRRGLTGGFDVTREGLRQHASGKCIPWEQICVVRSDAAGIVVASTSGDKLKASPYARHYCEIRVRLLDRANGLVCNERPNM